VTTYGLYLESGPKRRKTMVHVLELLGCIAVGPTTEEALAVTPVAIRAFKSFIARQGEVVDLDAPIGTVVIEHVTEGEWLGNGSPYLMFGPDLQPVAEPELETLVGRFLAMRRALATWSASQSALYLDALPVGGGRTARAILLHTLGATGGYLGAALGGAPGFGSIVGATERGQLDVTDGLRRVGALAAERVRATSPEERAMIRQRPHDRRTLRKALRRMLEHDWEHLAELSRRPGGPQI
jgi:predicted RNase H-like HicB family nuclease